ncbi:35f89424-9757-4290-bbdf-f4b60c6ae6a9 [Sclerotinia trifoliorum]|uniref:35f89424-9757-4290-bbdf-f4b60c6ae6a9 n=1 Tax=Sclerotinia trifoliorum TaxID=28548 RepID=A0A8H2W3N7_9HELO|nr:35f89424-9757-4290-bbdf-f4b60c6ae6a9 [Sclerotinia trifoliorum]
MAPIVTSLREIGTAGAQSLAIYLSEQPKSVLETIPSLNPPPGVVSDFHHRESRRGTVIIVSTFLLALALICICIRVWTKLMVARPIKLLWSDLTITISFFLAITAYVLTILNVTPGGTTGYHQYDVPLSETFTDRNVIPLCLTYIIGPTTIGLVKLTLFITYVEIFFTESWVKITCTIGAIISSAFYSIHLILALAWVIPSNGTPWRHQILSTSTLRMQSLSLPRGIVGLIIDVYLIIIPLIAVSKLHLTPKKKAGVSFIFAAGFIVIIGSTLSVVCRFKLRESDDVSWNLAGVSLVSLIEIFLSICIACTTDVSKFILMYKGKFKNMGCSLVSLSCCRNIGRNKNIEELAEEKVDSSDEEKSIQSKERDQKPEKLYPNLDIAEIPPEPCSDNSQPPDSVDRNEKLRRVVLAPGNWVRGSLSSLRLAK